MIWDEEISAWDLNIMLVCIEWKWWRGCKFTWLWFRRWRRWRKRRERKGWNQIHTRSFSVIMSCSSSCFNTNWWSNWFLLIFERMLQYFHQRFSHSFHRLSYHINQLLSNLLSILDCPKIFQIKYSSVEWTLWNLKKDNQKLLTDKIFPPTEMAYFILD